MNEQGQRGNGYAARPSLSDDGRLAVFISHSSNLVAKDTNDLDDVFLRNRKNQTVELVSVSSAERQANGESEAANISANGRYVVFLSYATNLVRNDDNRQPDIFLRDRRKGTTRLVSVSSDGRRANGETFGAAVSADGRFVAFTSEATNLVRKDTNDRRDLFLHDLSTRTTKRVNVSNRGRQANGGVADVVPAMSAHGQFIAFDSSATNLTPHDDNGSVDVFVHNRLTGETKRMSKGLGELPNGHSFNPSLSSDGRFVAYNSFASNLVKGDTNEVMDVFVYDSLRRKTTRVSVDSNGNQSIGNRDPNDWGTYGHSGWASISSDGRFVAFDSSALNLVPDDGNNTVDVFVHDRRTRSTTRVSVRSDGAERFGWSYAPFISPDGRWVAFTSEAGGLAPEDPDFGNNVFVHGPLW